MSPIQTELDALFTKEARKLAKSLDPASVDAQAVQAAARALLSLKGNPAEQTRFVQTMATDTAAALCRWLADPSFWAAVGRITKH